MNHQSSAEIWNEIAESVLPTLDVMAGEVQDNTHNIELDELEIATSKDPTINTAIYDLESCPDICENGDISDPMDELDCNGIVPPDISVAAPPDTTAVECPEPSCLAKKAYDQKALKPLIKPSFSLENAKPLDSATFPHQPKTGSHQLPGTLANMQYMLAGYHITARYNIIKKKLEIRLPGHSGTSDNMDNVSLTNIISLALLNGLPIGQVASYVEALADKNMYNPVADWITSKPWDGVDRLPYIYDTVTASDDFPKHFKTILLYRWLLSTVAAALKPSGFKARGVLTFQGPQGIGKTSWLMSLVNDLLLREMVVKVDHHLDGGNKDSVLGAVCHWLVEIGELDSSFKKDISRLKGVLTSDYDKVRRPYARTESEYPRRTVFFASVNQHDFLVDNTGNSRWWTIPVTKINYQHSIDMQQLFAQLALDFHNGKEWWLNQHEEALLNFQNKDHRSMSVIRERLLEKIDLELIGKDGNPAMSAIGVLIDLGYDKPTNPQCKEAAAILREMCGEPKKNRGIMKWRIPLCRHKSKGLPINDPYAPDDDDLY